MFVLLSCYPNNHWKWGNAVSLYIKKRQWTHAGGWRTKCMSNFPLIKSTSVFGRSLLLLLCPSAPQYNVSHFRGVCGIGKPCRCLATSPARWHRVFHDEETLLVAWVALNRSGCPTWKKALNQGQLFYENVIIWDWQILLPFFFDDWLDALVT